MKNITPQELVAQGEKIYFERREELEKANYGHYAVIDVESGEIVINPDKLTAIQEAQVKHPNDLFYIVQIGNLKEHSGSEINELHKYGWAI